jgi:kynureninase
VTSRHSRADAEAMDAADPLAAFVEGFVAADPGLCYLDGNSLGRLPRATAARLARFVEDEWGGDLVEGWDRWVDLPTRVGDELGRVLLGAAPGQVAVCDSVTVNLYKLAAAALAARPGPGTIVMADGEFPTDRYIIDAVAAQLGHDVRVAPATAADGITAAGVASVLDHRTALVCLSLVDYRSAALADIEPITALVHDAGGLMLWDLSHAVGSVPIDLDGAGVDVAVGCTYKYLNAGPGAPAFLYVRRELQRRLLQPIQGWFGHRDQFAMPVAFTPADGVARFLTGTPNIAGTVAVAEGVRLFAEAGIGAVRAKGQRLSSLMIALADAWLAELGFTLVSPRSAAKRGAHICLTHPDAAAISMALRADRVVADFRPPDRLRLGPAPLSSRFVEVWDAFDRLRRLVARGAHHAAPPPVSRVT